jgi:hypothetical protein
MPWLTCSRSFLPKAKAKRNFRSGASRRKPGIDGLSRVMRSLTLCKVPGLRGCPFAAREQKSDWYFERFRLKW